MTVPTRSFAFYRDALQVVRGHRQREAALAATAAAQSEGRSRHGAGDDNEGPLGELTDVTGFASSGRLRGADAVAPEQVGGPDLADQWAAHAGKRVGGVPTVREALSPEELALVTRGLPPVSVASRPSEWGRCRILVARNLKVMSKDRKTGLGRLLSVIVMAIFISLVYFQRGNSQDEYLDYMSCFTMLVFFSSGRLWLRCFALLFVLFGRSSSCGPVCLCVLPPPLFPFSPLSFPFSQTPTNSVSIFNNYNNDNDHGAPAA